MNTTDKIHSNHYAFKVSDWQFDEIFSRLKNKKIKYCSTPSLLISNQYDFLINHLNGGKGVYFKDPNGHCLEIITTDYDIGT